LERMEALEARIRGLVDLVQQLKEKNAVLDEELRAARDRLSKQNQTNRRWEVERNDVRSRIEKVLEELESLECLEEFKEVALD
ncbi:MAG: cell division protein ZapB, partial [Nitrospirae bacterium]